MGRKRREKKMEAAKSKVETILGEGTSIDGEIYTKGSLRVEGEIKGNIKAAGDLFVGEKGSINSQIEARNVIIAGKVEGNIRASQKIEIMPSGKLIGDISTNILKIEEGAVFSGSSTPLEEKQGKTANLSEKAHKEVAASKKEG